MFNLCNPIFKRYQKTISKALLKSSLEGDHFYSDLQY